MIPGFDEMTLDERREALWGLRDGCALHMNRVRLDGFEAVKSLLSMGSDVKVINRAAPCITKHSQSEKTVERLYWPARNSNNRNPMWAK